MPNTRRPDQMSEAYKGRTCYGGWDLGAVSDLTAWALLFPDDSDGYDVLMRFWAPESDLPALDKRTAGMASVWVRDGWLTLTPGDVTDYGYVEKRILMIWTFSTCRPSAMTVERHSGGERLAGGRSGR